MKQSEQFMSTAELDLIENWIAQKLRVVGSDIDAATVAEQSQNGANSMIDMRYLLMHDKMLSFNPSLPCPTVAPL